MQIEGLVLGKYRVEKLINNGSFASVFRAKEELTNRTVAIKALSKSVYPSGRTHYLLTELSAMGMSWGHPNIVSIHTVEPGDDEYIAYIVMEYVDGPSLRKLTMQPLPRHLAINIGLDICRGLIAAHEHNIIHRDIKPQNILLTSDYTAKISDFGVARILEETSEYAGTITGTRKYMAPEQYEGNYDYRADIYATGLILHEMLTGRFPFRGESHDEIQMKKRFGEIEFTDEFPNDLRDLLRKTLHRDLRSRYQTANEMYTDLDEIRKQWYADEAWKAINTYSNPTFLRTTLSKCQEDFQLSAEAIERIELELFYKQRAEEAEKKRLEIETLVDVHYGQAMKHLDSTQPQRALQEMQQAHRLYLTNVEATKKADWIFRKLSDGIVPPEPAVTSTKALINLINGLPANEMRELKTWFYEQFPPTEPSALSTVPYTTVRETSSSLERPGSNTQEPSPESILRKLHREAQNLHEINAAQICQLAERYAYQGNQRKSRSEYKKLGDFYRKHAEDSVKSEDWKFAADYYVRSRFAYMAAHRHRNARHSAREAGIHYAQPAALLEKQKNWAEAGRLYVLSAENHTFAELPEAADESRLRATICYFNVAENAYTTGNLKEAYDYCKKTLMIANVMKRPSNAAPEARKLIKEIEALFTASWQRQSSQRSLR